MPQPGSVTVQLMRTPTVPDLLGSALAALDEASVPYAIQRNFSDFPEQVTGDVDLTVRPEDLDSASDLLAEVAASKGWSVFLRYRRPSVQYIGFFADNWPERYAVVIELFAGVVYKHVVVVKAETLLSLRTRHNGYSVLGPEGEASVTVLHHLLWNGSVPSKYHARLAEILPGNSQVFERIVTAAIGSRIGTQIARNVADGHWDAVASLSKLATKACLTRYAYRHPLRSVADPFRVVKAKQEMNEGFSILVGGAKRSQVTAIARELHDHADRWHLFIPSRRKVRDFGRIEPSRAASFIPAGWARSSAPPRGGFSLVTAQQEHRCRPLVAPGLVFMVRYDESRPVPTVVVSTKGCDAASNASQILESAGSPREIAERIWFLVLRELTLPGSLPTTTTSPDH